MQGRPAAGLPGQAARRAGVPDGKCSRPRMSCRLRGEKAADRGLNACPRSSEISQERRGVPCCGETPGEAGSRDTLPEGRGEWEVSQALPEHMTTARPVCACAPQDGRPPSGLDISPDSPRPVTGPPGHGARQLPWFPHTFKWEAGIGQSSAIV